MPNILKYNIYTLPVFLDFIRVEMLIMFDKKKVAVQLKKCNYIDETDDPIQYRNSLYTVSAERIVQVD